MASDRVGEHEHLGIFQHRLREARRRERDEAVALEVDHEAVYRVRVDTAPREIEGRSVDHRMRR